MKIVITSQGKTLKDDLDPRFGRCQYFLIVDNETNEVEAIPNPQVSAGVELEFKPLNLWWIEELKRY